MNRFNYSKTARELDDSDTSEADPTDIAKILKDTEDMDGDLFKNMNKAPIFGNKNNDLMSKTLPASGINKTLKKNAISFDDDPLADIDTIIGKNATINKPLTSTRKDQNSSSKLSFNLFDDNKNDKKPPLSQTLQSSPVKKTAINFDFDMDDSALFDNLSNKPKTQNPIQNQPSKPPGSKSIVDDLFGHHKTSKEDEKVSSTNNSFEFKLNEKYLNMSQQASKANQDEDVSFGGYIPTAATTNLSKTSSNSKRSVAFPDDMFNVDIFATLRPKTAQESTSNKREDISNSNSMMKTMPLPSSKSDDWLGGSSSGTKLNDFDLKFDDVELKPKQQSTNLNQRPKNNENNWLTNSNTSSDRQKPLSEKPPLATSTILKSNLLSSGSKDHIITSNKDSMNSSFADSVEINHEKQTNSNANFNNSVLSGLTNIMQPLKFDSQNKETTDTNAVASGGLNMTVTSEGEDGWLNTLISNKKTAPKKVNVQESLNDELDIQETVKNNMSYTSKSELINTSINNNNNFERNIEDNVNSYEKIQTTELSNNQKINRHENKFKVKNNFGLTNVNYDVNEIQAMLQKIKQLEYENQDLHMQLQHTKAHSDLQLNLIQESCDNRIKLMKEDNDNRINHFKEAKQALQNHIDLIEKEKQEMSNVYKKKTEDIQKECDMEMEKLRQIQRDVLDRLKEEHHDALKRVKQLKDTEVDAAMAATSHTRTIETVLNLIEDNTKNLSGLSQKVQMGHMINLSEHEIKLKNKEEQLKIHEDRLLKQQKEYDNEIRLLNETIQRLESHLAEQSKSVAEERWKSKQQEKKLEALQDALVNEQRIVMEKLARDRNDVERSKDDILIEQKRLMQQIYEEKRKIAEERAQLESAINAYKDKQHKDSLNNINIEADITVSTRRINEERERLEQLSKDLKEKEIQLKQEHARLEERSRELDMKFARLEQMSFTVNQKYLQAEDLYNKSSKEKEEQSRLMDQTNSIKLSHESRLNQIQQQLNLLNEREAFINQEKISIYKQRQELELFKSNITCTKCKEPVKEFGQQFGLTLPSSGYGSFIQASMLTSTAKYQSTLNNKSLNVSDIEDAKMFRQLKIQALRDRQFINEEKQFIDTLTNNSSGLGTLNSRSMSMNRLNLVIS